MRPGRRAMILDAPRTPLPVSELPMPAPGSEHVLLRVLACGICRTDLVPASSSASP